MTTTLTIRLSLQEKKAVLRQAGAKGASAWLRGIIQTHVQPDKEPSWAEQAVEINKHARTLTEAQEHALASPRR